jgi:superfamily II DNA/RNA helicase
VGVLVYVFLVLMDFSRTLLQDHIERGNLDFSSLKFRVLDEADEMLRMGFVEDVELILGM